MGIIGLLSIYKSSIFGFHGCLLSREYFWLPAKSEPRPLQGQVIGVAGSESISRSGNLSVVGLLEVTKLLLYNPWKTNIRGTPKNCWFVDVSPFPGVHLGTTFRFHVCFQGCKEESKNAANDVLFLNWFFFADCALLGFVIEWPLLEVNHNRISKQEKKQNITILTFWKDVRV